MLCDAFAHGADASGTWVVISWNFSGPQFVFMIRALTGVTPGEGACHEKDRCVAVPVSAQDRGDWIVNARVVAPFAVSAVLFILSYFLIRGDEGFAGLLFLGVGIIIALAGFVLSAREPAG